MYLPPNTTFLPSYFDSVRSLSGTGSVLIGADLNARHPLWGDALTNRSGRGLYDFLLTCPDYEIHQTDGPTRINAVMSSYIDIFLTSVDISTLDRRELRTLDYESDHRAVEIEFMTGDCTLRERVTRYDFDKMDTRIFRNVLARNLVNCSLPDDRNVSEREIDTCITDMNAAFLEAMECSIPKLDPGGGGLRRLPSNILQHIQQKKRLRRSLWRCEDQGRTSILKAVIRNLDRIIQGAVAAFDREYWANFLSNIRLNSKTYRKVKSAAGLNTRPKVGCLHNRDGRVISNELEKANLLAESLFGERNASTPGSDESFTAMVSETVSTLEGTPLSIFGGQMMTENGLSGNFGGIRFVNAESVGSALRRRSGKKSSGADGIPDFVVKRTDVSTWRFLAVLFNHCLNIGYFPRIWKEAIVVPILKPRSDPRQVGSYRPISLLSPFGKLLEYFILSSIKDKIDEGGILKDFQFGFRSGLSTSHALIVFSDYVARGLNRRCPTLALGLDFSKAFDTVWRNGMIYKMIEIGFGSGLCRIVSSFLNDRRYRVRMGEVLSYERSTSAGVPQGSLLGPVLYNIFVSDLPNPPDDVLLLVYADDILLALSGARASTVNGRLNDYLNKLHDYFLKWGLHLNMEKTVAMMIKGRRKHIFPNCRKYVPCLRIGGELIRTSDRMRYLGVTFHENFEFYRHIDDVLLRARRVYCIYQGILKRKIGLDRRIKLLLYRQIIRPLISYAFPSWFAISSSQMERLRRWERVVLAACLGMRPCMGPSGVVKRPSCMSIYRGAEFGRIDAVMIAMAVRFMEGASNVDNRLVLNCFSTERSLETVRVSRYLSPVDLLILKGADLLYDGADLRFYHRRIGTFNIVETVYNTAQ